MKKFSSFLYIFLLFFLWSYFPTYASLQSSDSTHLPPIRIDSPNGFGPYQIGTKRTNIFTVTSLPDETSKVTFSFIDSKGFQVGESYSETGTGLGEALWIVESDTMDFPLSPSLKVEVNYKTDSVAVYEIAYLVYPDTIKLSASEGWGPFITNNYTFADTTWQPIPPKENTFTIKNLPPRTDTVAFQILKADSTVIDSIYVGAAAGSYLDSAVYSAARMDMLPLETRLLRALIWSEGGSKAGFSVYHNLSIMHQKPRLISIMNDEELLDSIGTFVQNQLTGNALLVDSTKYAIIQNGPGIPLAFSPKTQYQGPYSLNLIIDELTGNYTVEAWIKLDLEKINSTQTGVAIIMAVDSVWQLSVVSNSGEFYFVMQSTANTNYSDLFRSSDIFTNQLQGEQWHHVAFCSYWDYNSPPYPVSQFYFDGIPIFTRFNSTTFDYIKLYVPYKDYLKTKPLLLGAYPGLLPAKDSDGKDFLNVLTALDEVRIWNRKCSADEIRKNFREQVLQETALTGYWNFNDRRNRLNYISDISYSNNPGHLKNGASFIPQYSHWQNSLDTLMVYSSNALTNTIIYQFIDLQNNVIDTDTLTTNSAGDTLLYDISQLPYTISHLNIRELFPGAPDTGFVTSFNMTGLVPFPIATPQYNWNKYVSDTGNMAKQYAPITLSGLPLNTKKVTLGLTNGEEIFDTVSYLENSIPFRYSLTLNGSDNYIETTDNITSPENFTMMFWVKSISKSGGKIMGFSSAQNGLGSDHDREIIMRPDGSLRFNLKSDTSVKILSGVGAINDGGWHHVAAVLKDSYIAKLYVDGCIVDSAYMPYFNIDVYQGYWIIGRNDGQFYNEKEKVAEYFSGTLSEISIWDISMCFEEINALRFCSETNANQSLHYKLDEGTGSAIHDSQGDNLGAIFGSSHRWQSTKAISFVTWNHDMLQKPPDSLTFFAKLFYPGSPADGAYYPLGNFLLDEFDVNYFFEYSLTQGQGFFNEGTYLKNQLKFKTNYTTNYANGWEYDYLRCVFVTLDHEVIDYPIHIWTSTPASNIFELDMGEAPPGSYLSLQFGYVDSTNFYNETKNVSIPLYIRPMIPPKVSGNFGPFDQAIAPGTMKHDNTFIITTEMLDDLNRVTAKFYDENGSYFANQDAVKINDTCWHLTYDMAALKPPVTKMELEYFLGTNPHPALVEGPFPITVHRIRPYWFDFNPDSDFSDIREFDDEVTFAVTTPLFKNAHGSLDWKASSSIPFFNDLDVQMGTPYTKAYLSYNKCLHQLSLEGKPEFRQYIISSYLGPAKHFQLDFYTAEHDYYYLDGAKNLHASQNWVIGGSFKRELCNVAKRLKKMIYYLKTGENLEKVKPSLISPSLTIALDIGGYYASRIHMETDSATGRWGAIGDLDIDANPDHVEAYMNSASYHFYAMKIGTEFSVGMQLFNGFAGVNFATEFRTIMGVLKSYVSVPNYSSDLSPTESVQIIGSVYITVLWGWYKKNIWGPKLWYSYDFDASGMSHLFEAGKNPDLEIVPIPNTCSRPGLVDSIYPVSSLSKINLPVPEPTMERSDSYTLISWIEAGKKFGERKLHAVCLDKENMKFTDKFTVEVNNNAINGHVSEAISEDEILLTWAQSRHTDKSIRNLAFDDVLEEFVKSQDIYFAIYDVKSDTLLQLEMINDDTYSRTSGRTETNPAITLLSENKAIIIWQVTDLETDQQSLLSVLLERNDDMWNVSDPEILPLGKCLQSNLKISVTSDEKAVAVWVNTCVGDTSTETSIMTASFDGLSWNSLDILVESDSNHHINYLDMNFQNGVGAVLWTSYNSDTLNSYNESLNMIPWDINNGNWSNDEPIVLLIEPSKHLQLPKLAINQEGQACIAIKSEIIGRKTDNTSMSQIDLLHGDLKYPYSEWKYVEADKYVCDTMKQVADLQISYIGKDTLILITNEFPMLATNSSFNPVNGIVFGDPYMNLVLRSFALDESGTIQDIDEHIYFVGLNELSSNPSNTGFIQNYPNPCDERTIIKFEIAENSDVLMELFDISGIRIATLINTKMKPDLYEIGINTALLKTGTYICKLSTAGSVATTRIIVNH